MHSRPLRLSLVAALLALASPAAADPRRAPARCAPAPIPCSAIGQNQLTVQFHPTLRLSARGGRLVVDGAPLSATQAVELRRLQAVVGARWESAIAPAMIEALRAQEPGNVGAREALAQLGAFVRVSIGGAPQRNANVHTGTSFDQLPVMSPAVCTSVAALFGELRAMSIVSSASVSEIPAPPP